MLSNQLSVPCVFVGIIVGLFCCTYSAPVETNTLSSADIAALTNNTEFADILNGGDFTVYNQTTTSNGTEKQLYVIKAVVYEVGILTEVDENATDISESSSHERVDLTFFNAHKNGSLFNFGDIPVPIQANITGHTYTEILPIHIGDGIKNISDIASILPLPEHVLNFTQAENTLFQYQTSHIHHDHHDSETENHKPALIEEVPLQLHELPSHHHQHVSSSDLLTIPHIANSIVIDSSSRSSSSSSSSEEGNENKLSEGLPLGVNPLAASSD